MSDVLTRLTSALDSRYRIAREVGVGGMATVFLAHDLRHERDVAIKVLHPDLAAALGAERFLAEIKTTAKLQHPHILPLLDSGEAGGLLYYVMPYVAGESLRARLDRETQLAVDDSVRIAREVASALDYAHRHGVVHRDIKPENILIHEDQALVADFGIALAVSAAGGARMTQTGLSLGTPQYMSPEQAMGERAIDGRADIYALGAVTYEMLVGEPPFTGPTVQAIVARVMTENPRPVTGQRRSVQSNVNAAVMKALEKLPADRFHTAAEFSNALTSPAYEAPAMSRETVSGRGSPSRRPIAKYLPWAIAGAAAVSALFLGLRPHAGDEETPMRLSLDLPGGAELPPGGVETIGISGDGNTVAVAATIDGRNYLLVRRLDEENFRVVAGSAGVTGSAPFSPDGRQLVFNADGALWRAPAQGGPPTRIAATRWAHVTWISNDALVYTYDYNSGLYRVSASGRDTATLTTPDRKKGELGHWWPQLLPDRDHVLFTNYTTPADRSKLEVLSLKTGKRQTVVEGGYYGRYADGQLLFLRGDGVMAVPFDPSGLKVKGAEAHVPLEIQITSSNGWGSFDVSSNGRLVYLTDASKDIQLAWSNEIGDEQPAADSSGRYSSFLPSPDGKKLAVVKDGDVWVVDRARRFSSRITRTEQREINLVWSPDSRQIIYARDVPQYDVFRHAADGSGDEEHLLTSEVDKEPTGISPDGRTLLFSQSLGQGDDVYAVSLDGAQPKPYLLIGGQSTQTAARFSPDGRWIAYTSTESGRSEVYLSPYPTTRGPARMQISDKGGEGPEWAPDGKTLYYSFSGLIRRVRVNPEAGEIGEPEVLRHIPPALGWTMAPDGRFLVARVAPNAERHSVKILLNWRSVLGSGK